MKEGHHLFVHSSYFAPSFLPKFGGVFYVFMKVGFLLVYEEVDRQVCVFAAPAFFISTSSVVNGAVLSSFILLVWVLSRPCV